MSIKKSLAEAESDLQSAERLDEWAKWGLWISFGAPIFAMIGGLGDLFLSILIVSLLGILGCISVMWMNTTNIELAIKKRDRKKHLLKSTEKQKIAQKELMEDRKKREETQLKEILELIEGDVDDLKGAIRIMEKPPFPGGIFLTFEDEIKEAMFNAKTKLAGEYDNLLRYKEAIDIWEELGKHDEARRIRKKMREEGKVKVDQTVVHGDYVDDRDTIVKDSVLNRSNVGAGGKTKGERIKLIKELLDSGAIDDDEFKQMKKEILGK